MTDTANKTAYIVSLRIENNVGNQKGSPRLVIPDMNAGPTSTSETGGWNAFNANIAEQGGDVNTLHLAVTLNKIGAEVFTAAPRSDNAGVPVAVPSSTYSILNILENVNLAGWSVVLKNDSIGQKRQHMR